MAHQIAYIYDNTLKHQCDRLPTMLNRASIVQDLINAYGILCADNIIIKNSVPASEEDLKLFHSNSYIQFIRKTNDSEDLEEFEEEQLEFGLGYDCPLLEKCYDFIKTIAGGSLTAANLLLSRSCRIAINWFGGWHHAQKDEAEGFCYVNDVVIAIQVLTKEFTRILYIDLDIHHGKTVTNFIWMHCYTLITKFNCIYCIYKLVQLLYFSRNSRHNSNGVQNAFELSKRVLTISFHKNVPGFYPGTGQVDDVGCLNGTYYSINVPFLEGVSDQTFSQVFAQIFPRVFEKYKPNALVVQCGADGLNGDPIGQCNLTMECLGRCVQQILDCSLPTLFLGGGGYDFANTARYWSFLTALIAKKQLENDIPDHCEYFTKYGPTYELRIDRGNQKDYNSEEYISSLLKIILGNCNSIL